MKIDKSQTHTRYFLAMHRFWNWFFSKNQDRDYYIVPTSTDICLYIRTTVLYPLLLTSYIGVPLAAMFWSVVGYPISVFGVLGYLVLLLSLGALIGFLALMAFLSETKTGQAFFEKRKECTDQKASWWKCFKQWVQDRHDKICTLVEIIDKDKTNENK